MKTDSVFKRAYNDAVDLLCEMGEGAPLPSEVRLALRLEVSRTTARKVLAALTSNGLVAGGPGCRNVLSVAGPTRRFLPGETVSPADRIESRFMEWMQRAEVRPGASLNELDLARRFGVATTAIRELLHRFARFGLVERKPNGRWKLRGFTQDFATELFDVRELFEMRAARYLAKADATAPVWGELRALRQSHLDLLERIDSDFEHFPALDNAFHRLVIRARPNRFADSFFDVISMIFHYHYQWDRSDERQRNETALKEHLDYIDALMSRDELAIDAACRKHLSSARRTLLACGFHG